MFITTVITIIFVNSFLLREIDCLDLGPENGFIPAILSGYKKEARPVGTLMKSEAGVKNTPNVIYQTLALYQILDVDNRKQTITFSGALAQFWNDTRLAWDPSKYDYTVFTAIPSELLWRPDVGLFSSVRDLFDISEVSKNKAIIISNGSVWWNVVRVFTSTCQMNMQYFPFDWQTCHIKFSASTGFTPLMVFRVSGGVNLDFYTNNSEWDLIDASATISELRVPSMENDEGGYTPKMSTYNVALTLQRRSQYYWIHLIIPCMFISFLVCFVFVMPADAGEKISFSVTILLAFTVYQLIIAESLPKGSDSISLLSIYLTALVSLSAVSVVLSILVLNVYHRDPKIPIPGFIRKVILLGFAKLVCKKVVVGAPLKKTQVHAWKEKKDVDDVDIFKVEPKFVSPDEKNMDIVKGDLSRMPNDEPEVAVNEWKLAAEIIDRFFLMLFGITTFLVNFVVLIVLPCKAKESMAV